MEIEYQAILKVTKMELDYLIRAVTSYDEDTDEERVMGEAFYRKLWKAGKGMMEIEEGGGK